MQEEDSFLVSFADASGHKTDVRQPTLSDSRRQQRSECKRCRGKNTTAAMYDVPMQCRGVPGAKTPSDSKYLSTRGTRCTGARGVPVPAVYLKPEYESCPCGREQALPAEAARPTRCEYGSNEFATFLPHTEHVAAARR